MRKSLFACIAALGGCAINPGVHQATGAAADATAGLAKTAAHVIGAPLIPDATIQLGPTTSFSLESLLLGGAAAIAAYYVLDPLAPNWEIQEARFPGDHVQIALKMKRYYAGGAGEARALLHRRARELVREGGFARYEIVEYEESIDSSLLGAQRQARGVVRLIKG
ncbi:MAG: hypothetical protein N2441_11355 [Rhodocyclaceae bacterium]|nr:hypothetical protein [Rhodocyclaceae bacterium]